MDIFCKIVNGELPSNTCYEDEYVKCIMDANPNAPGHTLIIPKKHYTTLFDIDDEMLSKINGTAKMLIEKMEKCIPNIIGFKVAVNYGEEQKVKHYHMHIIPTYSKKSDLTQEEICKNLKK